MKLSHFTNNPLGVLRAVEQPLSVAGWASPHKPMGLWVSVDGDQDWKTWCESESFGLGEIRYSVTLREPNNILIIRSPEELLEFTAKYDKQLEMGGHSFKGHYMDWVAVAKAYQGVIITPYQWDLRLDQRTHWYYGWDCASGCIWDAQAIKRVEEVRQESVTA